MRDRLVAGSVLGYCTNAHSGDSWVEVAANLRLYAARVRSIISPDAPMGVGLWLSARAAEEIVTGGRIAEVAECLAECGLMAFTFNGFPYGDFHGEVVKHQVYRPNWCYEARAEYTIQLAEILAALLPEGDEGSISTLPLGWRGDVDSPANFAAASAKNLIRVAERLREIEDRTGRLIHLELEPEPGCVLDLAEDVVGFFEHHLLRAAANEALVWRYLRVCHDVCHAAVMCESQRQVIEAYRSAGIEVGKVQLSSAVRVDFGAMDRQERLAALDALRALIEPRYLHQCVRRAPDGSRTFFNDLPSAIKTATDAAQLNDEWRVHFHVPLFVERFGQLETTQQDIGECLAALEGGAVRHFEVETYAWNVLPVELRTSDLAAGIGSEIAWVCNNFGRGRKP